MQINITVVGDRAIALKFQRIPVAIHDRLLATITRLTEELYSRIEAAEPKLSGRLESRTTERITDRDNLIAGAVRIGGSRGDKLKALALEFGAHGTASVHAYSRGHDAAVSAYTRQVNIAEHRFLRGPFDAMAGEIEDEIKRAFAGAADAE